uniref:Uncharacterized protein n=1 Tax=Spermophilus dauricus TaxID=99837 RepID=A0A8C9QKI4_SPEDA
MSPRKPTTTRAPRAVGAPRREFPAADALLPSFSQKGSFSATSLRRHRITASLWRDRGKIQELLSVSELKKKTLSQTNQQTQEFPGLHQQLVQTSSARSTHRWESCSWFCRCSHLFSPWISLNESHLFFSLLLFILHLFLVLLGWLFPPGKVRCIISFAKKEEFI